MKMINIDNIEQLKHYATEWQTLLKGVSESSTVFLTQEWILNWYKYYGADKTLTVHLFFEKDRLVGIAPFVIFRVVWLGAPIRILRFMGTRQADHLDVYIESVYRREGFALLMEYLATGLRWDVMDLVDLPEDSENVVLLKELLSQYKFSYSIQSSIKCPYLRVENDDWDNFFAQKRSKSTRQDLRRRLRRLGELGDVEFRRYEDPAAVERIFPQLQTLYQKRWEDKFVSINFTSDKGRQFYCEMAADFSRQGQLDLLTVELNDQVIAFTLSLVKDHQFTWLLTAHDPSYDRYFAGEQVIIRMLEDAFKRSSILEIDFTRGDEPYKYKWASNDRYNVRVLVSNRGLQSKVPYFILLNYHILRREAKKSMFLKKLKLDVMGQIKMLIQKKNKETTKGSTNE